MSIHLAEKQKYGKSTIRIGDETVKASDDWWLIELPYSFKITFC